MPPSHTTNAGNTEWAAFVPPGRGTQWPWKKKTIGVFSLGLFALVAVVTCLWGVQHFEKRLEKSARYDLATAGVSLDQLQFNWSYRDLLLSGEITADIGEQKIIDILSATDNNGIRNIDLQLVTSTIIAGSVTDKGTIDIVATLADGKITLSGPVLTEAQRQRLYEAAANAVGAENVIRQLLVSGLKEAIPGADQRVESFATSLAGLDQATAADAALSATDLRFNATVEELLPEEDEIPQPQGPTGDIDLVISGDIVAKKTAPGGVMDAVATLDDGRILLEGVVLTEQQKQRLLAAAMLAVEPSLVEDQLTVVNSTDDTTLTDDRVATLAAAIETFPQAIEARARVTVNDLDFDALVKFEEETLNMRKVRAAAAASGLQVNGGIEAQQISLQREVTLLQQALDELLAEINATVVFESAKSELDFDAKQTLDKVVDAMNRLQRPVVLIAGHTDSTGSRIDNEQLSFDRASAVRDYLEKSGIEQRRVRSVGFGESVPIASNETEVGKKQNRRVEFSARGAFDR